MPHMMDAAEAFDLLQRWDQTPIESPEAIIAFLDRLLLPPLNLNLCYQEPETESAGLNARSGKDFYGVRAQSAMVVGAFPRILAKVRACASTPAGQAALEAWAEVVLAERNEAARQIPAELRSLLVMYLMPEIAWGLPDIRDRLGSVLRFHTHLAADLIQDPERPIALRTNLLTVIAGRSDTDHLSFLQALASPARAELMAYAPFRRFLWKRLFRTIENGTFQNGAQLAVFNLLVETSDDRELTPLVGSALQADPHLNEPAARSWARVLAGLEAAGRLEGLLPPGLSFRDAYVSRFVDEAAAEIPHGWHRLAGGMNPDELAVKVAAVRAGRLERDATLPDALPTPRLRGGSRR